MEQKKYKYGRKNVRTFFLVTGLMFVLGVLLANVAVVNGLIEDEFLSDFFIDMSSVLIAYGLIGMFLKTLGLMFSPKEILIDQEMIFIPRLSKRYKDRTIYFENINSIDSHIFEGTESFVKIRVKRKSIKVNSNQFKHEEIFHDFVSYITEIWKGSKAIKSDFSD